MTLEQRVEALEKIVANLKMPSGKAEELAKMMRDTAAEVIKNAQRPGGVMHQRGDKAASEMTAKYDIHVGVNYDNERERLLDIATTSVRDSLHLSRL